MAGERNTTTWSVARDATDEDILSLARAWVGLLVEHRYQEALGVIEARSISCSAKTACTSCSTTSTCSERLALRSPSSAPSNPTRCTARTTPRTAPVPRRRP